MLWYRGTQTADPKRSVRGPLSFTPCLAAAVIWAARPGDVWSDTPARFTSDSTVSAAHIDATPVLELGGDLMLSVADVLRLLHWGQPDGITHGEALRIYNYLHNRLIGNASGGEFWYEATEDGEPIESDMLMLLRGWSRILEARENFDWDPTLEEAGNVVADVFIFADTPIVAKVAARLGYRGLSYPDVFEGASGAAEDLMGLDDIDRINCIEWSVDGRGEYVPYIPTLRPLKKAHIEYQWHEPAPLVAARVIEEISAP